MKKVLAVVLAVVLAFGMASIGFAAPNKIKSSSDSVTYYLGASGAQTGNAYAGINDDDWDEEVRAGTKKSYYLNPKEFEEEDGGASVPTLTTSKFSSSNLTVKRKVSKGSELIKKIELKNYSTGSGSTAFKTVYIEVEMIDPFVSTSSKDFDFTVYLAKKGTKISDSELQITGTMENEVIEVDEGEDEVNLSEGHVAKAIAYIKSIKVDTGNGLYINTKMFEDKKYYAQSTQDISSDDDAVITRYPQIDTIYTLQTVNMNSAGNTVEFDIDERYYVYDADGKYIGMTTDKTLPFSSKYYLATQQIDMGAGSTTPDEDDGDDNTVPVDTANPGSGGDDVPVNVNDNPGTGANGFVNVAVAAGLVALVAAGAVSMKK